MSTDKGTRASVITDNNNYCVDNWEYLTEWEKGFIGNVQNMMPSDFTQPRFNKLHDVRESLRQRIWHHIRTNDL